MKPKEQKRDEAQKRQATHDTLTQDQKIARAVIAPGRSLKELTRLGGSRSVARRLNHQIKK